MIGVSTKTRLDLDKIGLVEHIWEFVDSHELPSEWGKLDRENICYSSKVGKNSTHFSLKNVHDVQNFLDACRGRYAGNVYLCVYSEKKPEAQPIDKKKNKTTTKRARVRILNIKFRNFD